ncbi:hypothetical protein BGZ68_010067 [Mortierella alpina]|nr:hypothetical protein BGZ68_010067 [Mortierella alpina]
MSEKSVGAPTDSPFAKDLQTSAMIAHLEQLYAIAPKHNNSRAVMDEYMDSAEYVQSQLKTHAANFCDVSTQEFKVPIWKELEEPQLSALEKGENRDQVKYKNKVDFKNYGNVKGKVAVVESPIVNCTQALAAAYAQKAGATGVLFYNLPGMDFSMLGGVLKFSWNEGDPLMTIPALAIFRSLGLSLLQNQHSVHLTLATKNSLTVESTINVLCTTKNGQVDNTVVIGAHLDSVPAGPGINDNGSGSSAVLETALTLANNNGMSSYEIKNKLVFAWWGGEEIGLYGFTHYVRDLSAQVEAAKQRVALNLNFDMLASPNYVPFIYNGTTASGSLIVPSTKIEHRFGEYFKMRQKTFKLAHFSRTSDYWPFLDAGIPAGGLQTGAGAPYDACYHLSCDTIKNINEEALELMSQAALYATTKLASASNLRDWLSGSSVQML